MYFVNDFAVLAVTVIVNTRLGKSINPELPAICNRHLTSSPSQLNVLIFKLARVEFSHRRGSRDKLAKLMEGGGVAGNKARHDCV